MKDKIKGRTPEEIKKGLDCCIYETDDSSLVDHCRVCPYQPTGLCIRTLLKDALAYIQQLERERDAAVEDMKLIAYSNSKCETCARYAFDEEDESRVCADCDVETYSNWQWRGAQEVE